MPDPVQQGRVARRGPLSIRRVARSAAGLLVLVAAACHPGEKTVQDTLLQYMNAVQEEDLGALYCLSAGAAEADELGLTEEERRAGFRTWAGEWYRAYREGRDAGRVEIGGHGVALVKLFSLGRGTFYEVVGTRRGGPGTLEVDTRLRFGYSAIDLSRFSPGTTFYLCGAPPGVVHAVTMEPYREVSLEVLDTLVVRWVLVREDSSGGCPGRWAVASAEPLEETATTEQITWVF
jgi:hypothetical protein